MENEKWTCAICGRKNTEPVCIQCGNPKGTKFKNKIEDMVEESIPPLPKENENKKINNDDDILDENDNRKQKRFNDTKANTISDSTDKVKIYLGIISVLVCIVVFLGFKIYNDQKTQNDVIKKEVTNNQTNNSKTPSNKNEMLTQPKKEEQQKETKEPIEIINAKNDNQKLAISAFYNFHKKITEHKLREAYEIFSPNLQGQISYEGWVPGFDTTVSSTPSDVKILSESNNTIVLTYYLKAVDNPGGTQNFTGTVTLIKVNNNWKIDDIHNKIK